MRGVILRLLCVAPAIALAVFGYRIYVDKMSPKARGRTLSNEAFDASFTERGLAVPDEGPREGFWGNRMRRKIPDNRLGWREHEDHVPGRIDIDEHGCQYFKATAEPSHRILILGGSVAWGAYASSVRQTYFALLGRRLESDGIPAHITVLATGAWKSHQDLRGLEARLEDGHHYDLVVFLNGLNDMTNGPTADTLSNGAPVATLASDASSIMGEEFGGLPHSGDLPERVEAYLANMRRAFGLTRVAGAELIIALQPSLHDQDHPSDLEAQIRENATDRSGSTRAHREGYAAIRAGLAELGEKAGVRFVDLSRLFATEQATTFVDIWHFSDPGHRLVADRLAEAALPILRRR
jgi:lysophospholipase L1-like esterase